MKTDKEYSNSIILIRKGLEILFRILNYNFEILKIVLSFDGEKIATRLLHHKDPII